MFDNMIHDLMRCCWFEKKGQCTARRRMLKEQTKSILRKDWYRVTQRRQVFMEKQFEPWRCAVSLLCIDGVTAPLYVGEERLLAADAGFQWLHVLPEGQNWCLTAMYDAGGDLVQFYFDITLQNILCGEDSCFIDLYLDISVLPDGRMRLLDRDELDEALRSGVITEQEHGMALQAAELLQEQIAHNSERLSSFCMELLDELRSNLHETTRRCQWGCV